MKITAITPYELINQAFCDQFKSLKYYGESVFQQNNEDSHRFVTVGENPLPCSVDDNFDVTAFFLKENANSQSDGGYGSFGSFTRKVECVLAVNCKNPNTELIITALLNNIREIEYVSTDFNSETVSREFFGIEDQNYQTIFFSIRFLATEKIVCAPC